MLQLNVFPFGSMWKVTVTDNSCRDDFHDEIYSHTSTNETDLQRSVNEALAELKRHKEWQDQFAT